MNTATTGPSGKMTNQARSGLARAGRSSSRPRPLPTSWGTRIWRLAASALAAAYLLLASTWLVNETAMIRTTLDDVLNAADIDTVRIRTSDADVTLRATSPDPSDEDASSRQIKLTVAGSQSLRSSELTHRVVGRTLDIQLDCAGAAVVGGRCVHRLDIDLNTAANVEIVSEFGDIDAAWQVAPRRITAHSGCGDLRIRVPRRADGYRVSATGGIQAAHNSLINNPDSEFRIDAISECGQLTLGS